MTSPIDPLQHQLDPELIELEQLVKELRPGDIQTMRRISTIIGPSHRPNRMKDSAIFRSHILGACTALLSRPDADLPICFRVRMTYVRAAVIMREQESPLWLADLKEGLRLNKEMLVMLDEGVGMEELGLSGDRKGAEARFRKLIGTVEDVIRRGEKSDVERTMLGW